MSRIQEKKEHINESKDKQIPAQTENILNKEDFTKEEQLGQNQTDIVRQNSMKSKPNQTKQQINNLNDFSLLNQIGSGSFSKVFKVKHKITGEIFAAKVSINEIQDNSDDIILDLSREVNILAKLDHPSVLKFIFFSTKNFKGKLKPVIITEYSPNGSLSKLIEKVRENPDKSILNDTQKLIIIYGIAEAMSYLHSHEIIHRDLKPENILLDEHLLPKIADFGLSKVNHSMKSMTMKTMNNSIKGTPLYMAPEIWGNLEYSKSSDVYAFALITYEIITNEKPFQDLNFFQLPIKIKEGIRPDFKASVPISYQQLIQSCWQQNPEDRPTFDQIIFILSNYPDFITENVNKDEYKKYIEYIKEYKKSFDSKKNFVFIDESNHINTISPLNPNLRVLTTIKLTPKIYPYLEYIKLDDRCKNIIDSAINNGEKLFNVAKALIEGHYDFPHNLQIGLKYLKESIKYDLNEPIIYYGNLLIKGKVIPQNLKKAKKLIDNRIKNNKSAYFLLLGKIYLKQSLYNEAKAAFKESMLYDNDEAMYIYGKMLYCGYGCSINKNESIKYFQKASERRNAHAMFKYGQMIINKEVPDKSKEEGIIYIKNSADSGFLKAMYYYSQILEKGEDISADKELSIHYLKKSADKGHTESMYKYGLYLQTKSKEDKKSNYEYDKYIKKASDKGYIDAIYQYGKILKNDDVVPDNEVKSAKYIKIAANNDNSKAISLYGKMLLSGRGVLTDKVEALEYIQKGIAKGDSNAMHYYASMLFYGDGVPMNKEESVRYFKMAIDKGNSKAMDFYAYMLSNGYGVFKNLEEAAKYYKMAIDRGNTNSMQMYAYLLFREYDDKNGWFDYLKMAADNGNSFSMYLCGFFMNTGNRGVTINKKKALEYFKNSAEQGVTKSMVEYAKMLITGEAGVSNKEEGMRYLKIASDKGESDALVQYAEMLLNGDGIQSNKEEAVKYIKMAIEAGDSVAMFMYGNMLKNGDGISMNKEEAVKFYKMAIDKNNPLAMTNYAKMLENGDGIIMNKEEAIKYYKMAINEGNSEAMINYAKMLENGDGIIMNKEEAIKYYKMAISIGDSRAMTNYAKILENGDGIAMNKEEAIKYYKMAIDEGNSDAMTNYAKMLENGDGITMNKEEAVKYYKMAIKKGDSNAMYYYSIMLEQNDIPSSKKESIKYLKMSANMRNKLAIQKYNNFLDATEYNEIEKERNAIVRNNLHQKRLKERQKERRKSLFSLKQLDIKSFKELDDECRKIVINAEKDDDNYNDDLNTYVADSFIHGINNFPQNIEIGLKYLERACHMNNIEAIKLYFKTQYEGALVKRNIEKTIYLLNEIPHIYNHSKPKLELIKMLLSHESFDVNIQLSNVNYILAKKYCKKASDMLNTNAMVLYGKLCFKHKKNKYGEIYSDFDDSMKYFKLACDRGNSEGMVMYGYFMDFGKGGIRRNAIEAAKYYKMSYDRKNLTGTANYGHALIDGLGGTQKNELEGIKLLKASCDNNNPFAMNIYGYYLSQGCKVIEKNENLAFTYFKKAADLGNPSALKNMAYCYRNGKGTDINIRESIKYYKKSIEEGQYESAYDYGWLLLKGNEEAGIKKDLVEGNKYIKYAADQGDTLAMSDYIENMIDNLGVEMNTEDLYKYLILGIYLDDKYVYKDYAWLLYNGHFIPKDRVKAARYFKKSADLGQTYSIKSYIKMLEEGDGVEKNYEEAKRYRQMLPKEE